MAEAEVLAVLSTPEAVEAVAAGDVGAIIHLVRCRLGMRQGDLAAMIGKSQSAVSRLESGRTGHPHMLARMAGEKLGIPPEALGFTNYGSGGVFVERRESLRGLLGVAAVLAFPQVLIGQPKRLTLDDVTQCRDVLTRVDGIDTRLGGEAVYELSLDLVRRIQRLSRTAQCSDTVGRELRSVAATGWETAGWMAFDTGHVAAARTHWVEALHIAEVHDLQMIRLTVMADMALHATSMRWGTDAVELAQTAARSPSITPRVASLLAAREGLGYALRRDPAKANAAFVRSARLLDKSQHPDDPSWVDFWGPDDFASHRSKAAMLLGDYRTAENAARTALGGASSGPWVRNQALYRTRVGHILARRGTFDEAMATLRPVVVTQIGSGRVRAEVRTAVNVIRQGGDRMARQFSEWATRMVGAA